MKVAYVLHPQYGRTFKVLQRRCYGGEEYYEIDVEPTRWILSAWMTQADYCSTMTWGADPLCSLTSLAELQALLHSTGL